MLIDWFTVLAQVINFLILVWLLKRFLYRPILDAIDAREKRIAAEIAAAVAKEAEARKEREEFQRRNEVFDNERSARMNEVLSAAKSERAQLLDGARQEAEDLRARLQQASRNEQRNLNEEISRRAREEVFAVARQALRDLAGTSLEQRMTEIFVDRLRELDATQLAAWKSLLNAPDTPRVRTAFKLSTQQCAEIQTVITELLDRQTRIEFDVVPDLVSGIELSSGGHKIAWSVAGYLDSLSANIDELLKARAETESAGPADTARKLDKNDD